MHASVKEVCSAPPEVHRSTGWKLLLVIAFWGACLAYGMALLLQHENEPGLVGATPVNWPSETGLERSSGRPTLLVFLHPHCPCSRVTLGELQSIIAQCRDRVAIHVLFVQPDGTDPDWVHTDLWQTATALDGATTSVDVAGREAALFGARSSGHVLLFDSAGRLEFTGGITGSRSHAGDNYGRAAVVDLVNCGRRTTLAPQTSFVFGCRLANEPRGHGP